MPKLDALKFEAGSKQVLEITALGASIDLILKTGVSAIEKETLRLATKLRVGLEAKGYKVHSPYEVTNHQSAMVNFIPKDQTIEALKSIPCNFAIRGPGVRLTPAAFVSDLTIERVLKVL
jgi:selenocysteine lyase/cysteine desulfurase